jgi:hypothetical protein
MASADFDTDAFAKWVVKEIDRSHVERAVAAETKLAQLKMCDPDLFDPDERAEDAVYETYGSNGRYLREAYLEIMGDG